MRDINISLFLFEQVCFYFVCWAKFFFSWAEFQVMILLYLGIEGNELQIKDKSKTLFNP